MVERRLQLLEGVLGQPLLLHRRREDVGAERVVLGLGQVERAEGLAVRAPLGGVTFCCRILVTLVFASYATTGPRRRVPRIDRGSYVWEAQSLGIRRPPPPIRTDKSRPDRFAAPRFRRRIRGEFARKPWTQPQRTRAVGNHLPLSTSQASEIVLTIIACCWDDRPPSGDAARCRLPRRLPGLRRSARHAVRCCRRVILAEGEGRADVAPQTSSSCSFRVAAARPPRRAPIVPATKSSRRWVAAVRAPGRSRRSARRCLSVGLWDDALSSRRKASREEALYPQSQDSKLNQRHYAIISGR